MRFTWVVPGLLALGVRFACSSGAATGLIDLCDSTNPVTRITVEPSTATLIFRSPPLEGDGIQLHPRALSRFGTPRTDLPFSYSSDSAVAAVTDSGFVMARGVGSTTVTVSACDEDATVLIVVVSDVDTIDVRLASDTIATAAHEM
jgi:hypothetical protein